MLNVILLAFFAAIFGALLCFAGYRFFMVMLPVWSFFAGIWIGVRGVTLIFGSGFLAGVTGLTLGIILAIALAIFSWQFYELGVAVLAAVAGAWLSSGLLQALGFAPGSALMVTLSLIAAALAGVFTYRRGWQQYVVMWLTAIFGANSVTLAVLLLLGRVSMDGLRGAGHAIRPILQDSWFWSLLWLAIAIAGFAVQYRSYRHTVAFVRQEFVKYWS